MPIHVLPSPTLRTEGGGAADVEEKTVLAFLMDYFNGKNRENGHRSGGP